jgi:SPOR domain
MADRYQNRSFHAGDGYDRDTGSRASGNAESDPLAELARLIGQTDPFGTKPMSRANLTAQPQARPAPPQVRPVDPAPSYDDDYYEDSEPEEVAPPAPPSWMQRAARQEAPPPLPPQDDYPNEVHPLHRYAAEHPQAEPDYEPEPRFEEPGHQPDLSRYDEALYGGIDPGTQQTEHDQDYTEQAYDYEEDQNYEVPEPRRRSSMVTVAAVLALAVFGVGGALAYRSYTGSAARNGDPPIIRAEAGPTKIIPAPADVTPKVPDRLAMGDGSEKIVPREETPIDPGTRSSGPRVVFPPLTPNGSAAMPSGLVPGAAPAAANGGTFSNNDPRAVRTVSVRGDQASAGVPATTAAVPPAAAPVKPPRTAAARPSANPSAANANGPMSLAPQPEVPAVQEPVRVAATNPTQPVESAPAPSASGGSYLVSVTSQPSEAEAQASYRAMQNKYASVLGSQSAVVARGNTKDGKVTYRAGPAFANSAEAAQFCRSYQAAGGQCWVVKN